ncbi:hypothetical protein [Mycoplasmopsis edwardii]|nr:hypothetical protein [Mycoplasmopsis edwardii]
MKKITKGILWSSFALTIVPVTAACSPSQSGSEQKTINKDAVMAKIANIKKESDKTRLTTKADEAKNESELSEVEKEVNLILAKESAIATLQKSGFEEDDKTIWVGKIRLAKTTEAVQAIEIEIQVEIQTTISQLKSDNIYVLLSEGSKAQINELIIQASSLDEKATIKTKIDALYNEENAGKVQELVNELTTKINSINAEEAKNGFKARNVNTNSYLELKELEKEVDAALLEQRKAEILEAQKRLRPKYLKAKGFLAMLPTGDEKTALEAELNEISNENELDSFITKIEGKVASPTQDQINTLDKTNKEALTKKAKNDNITFEELKNLLTETSEKYAEELNKTKEGKTITNRIASIRTKNETLANDFQRRVNDATSKEDLNAISNEMLAEIRKYKPSLPSDLPSFKSSNYYGGTKPTDEDTESGNVIYTVRGGRNVPTPVKANTPSSLRTFDLSREDIEIKDKLVELRGLILKTFFEQSTIQGRTGYVFIQKVSNGQASTKFEISRLLWTVDKALIEGYYYNEIYNFLLGDPNAKGFSTNHTYHSLKKLAEGSASSAQTA